MTWVVQDVFSSGIPGPGFTVHGTEAEAWEEVAKRPSAAAPFRPGACMVCGSLLGLESRPLQGGCIYCR